jgi:PAS domain S-box-containing protein
MNGTVLILDDDAGVLELTALYLRTRGFSTLTCSSAQSAVAKLQEAGGTIGILIADVTLPDSSGVEVAVQLKKLTPELKILFVSGYSFEELSGPDSALYHLLPPSSVRFLRKPFSAQDLISRLLELTRDPPAAVPPDVFFEALERQSGLLDLVHDAIIARTLNGEIRYWNRGAEILYGWTKDQAIGKSTGQLLHTVYPEPFQEILDHLRKTGCWEGELCQMSSAGSAVTVSSRWGLRRPGLPYADSGEIEILEVNHDITGEARARSELRRSEQRFRTLWECAPDAVVIVDSGGSIVLLNTQAERQFGYRRDELLGKSVEMLLPERFRGRRLIGVGPELFGLRKNGEEFPVEVALSLMEADERMLIISPIREKSRSTRAGGPLTPGRSHDLRTPLHTVIGFADLLASEEKGPLNQDQARFVQHILTDSWRLLELIDEHVQQRWEVFDTSSAIEKVVSSLLPQVQAKAIQLETSVAGAHALHADPLRFNQVLYNLLEDAIRFTPEGGKVRIDAANRDGFVEIAVSDSAVGIPRDQREAPLAVLERLGGRIWRESQHLEGNCFTFALPAATRTTHSAAL